MADFELRKDPATGQVFFWEVGADDWRPVEARRSTDTGEVFILDPEAPDWRSLGQIALPTTPTEVPRPQARDTAPEVGIPRPQARDTVPRPPARPTAGQSGSVAGAVPMPGDATAQPGPLGGNVGASVASLLGDLGPTPQMPAAPQSGFDAYNLPGEMGLPRDEVPFDPRALPRSLIDTMRQNPAAFQLPQASPPAAPVRPRPDVPAPTLGAGQAIPPQAMPQNPLLQLMGPGAGGGMDQLYQAGILPRRYVENPAGATPQVNPLAAAMEPDPFAGEGLAALAARRGQQVAAGATDVVAAIPEAAAVVGEGADMRETSEAARVRDDQRAPMIADIQRRLQGPNLPPAERALLERNLADLTAGQAELTQRADQPIVPAMERPGFAQGEAIRQGSQEIFGAPDPRDQGFWSQVAYGGGNMAAMAGASVLGTMVGGPVTGTAIGAGLGASLNTPQVYEEAIAAGASPETAQQAAQWASLVGASEIVPITRALKLLPPRMRGEMTEGFMRRFVDIAQGSGEEAAQEYLATVANNIIAQQLYDPDRGWTEGALDAALVGAVLGGGMGALGSIAEGTPAGPDATANPRVDNPDLTQRPGRPNGGPAPLPSSRPQPPRGTAQPMPRPAPIPPEGQGPDQPLVAPPAPAPEPVATPPAAAAPPPEDEAPAPQAPSAPAPAATDQQDAAQDDGDFDVIPEFDVVDGETVSTGRMVRVNRETGEVSPLPDRRQADTGAEAEQGQPAVETEVDGGRPLDPAAGPAPQQATDDGESESGIVKRTLSSTEVARITTDARTFQYKDNGNEEGETGKLRAVNDWDERAAGGGIVYEYADGRRVIADGHQRLGLAKRLQARGIKTPWEVEIIREVDGYSPADVRKIAAMQNIRQETGTSLDAAKVLRDAPEEMAKLSLNPNSPLVRDAMGLAKLSPEGFSMVINGLVKPDYAAFVGAKVANPDAHVGILGLLRKLKPTNQFQAEVIVDQAAENTQTEQQTDLFGTRDVEENLYLERAKVLDNAVKRLEQDKRTFKTLVDRADAITKAGNTLATDNNAAVVDDAARVSAYLKAEANRKGPISDALRKAAVEYRANPRSGAAIVRDFLDAVKAAKAPVPDSGKPDRGNDGKPPQSSQPEKPKKLTGAEIERRLEAARAGYLEGDNTPIESAEELHFEAMGRALLDKLAETDSTKERHKIADDWVRTRPDSTTREYLVVFDKDGQPLSITRGESGTPGMGHSVGISRVVFRMLLDGQIGYTVHNHPRSTAASAPDIYMLSLGMDVLRVVGVDGKSEHTLRMGPTFKPLRKTDRNRAAEINEGLRAVDRMVQDYVQQQVLFGLPVQAANMAHPALVNLTLQRFGVISYDGTAAATLTEHGVDLDGFIDNRRDGIVERLRRAGLPFAEVSDPKADRPGEKAGSSNAGRPRPDPDGTAKPRSDVESGDGQGRVPDPVKTGDPDFDGALDDLFGTGDAEVAPDPAPTPKPKRSKADIAKDLGDIFNEDGDLFGTDAEAQAAAKRARDKALIEARQQQSKIRRGNQGRVESDEDTLFGKGAQGSLFEGATSDLDRLNRLAPGWTQSGDLLTNPTPKGGIIDKTLKKKVWFIVYNDDRQDGEFYQSRAEAIDAFARSYNEKYGPQDDPKYARAVPLFIEALDGIDVATMSRREVFTAMARPLMDAGLPRQAIVNMKPYFDRFLAEVESGQIDLTGDGDAPSGNTDLERDSGDGGPADGVGQPDVSATGGANGGRTGRGARSSGGTGGRSSGGGRVPAGNASGVGGRGDSQLSGPDGGDTGAATDRDGERGGKGGERGLPNDRGADQDAEGNAQDRADDSGLTRQERQAKADRTPVKPTDQENIAKTLPLLMPEQHDDVLKIETRFAKPDGHGMLLTNGTGTGKTYSGGGVIKRFVQRGKGNILVVAPSDGILNAWMAMGADMGIPMSKLADTKTAGQGVVVTTYANLGMNNALASRDWDLIVTDEAHKLSQNAAGDTTDALRNIRAISNRPDDLRYRSHMLHADEWAAAKEMPAAKRDAEYARLRKVQDADVAKFQGQPRSKVLFLSATPFSYDKNLDYAEGYLFSYGNDGVTDNGSRQGGRSFFFIQNFGYRIRYHKLTKPEGAVDSAVFEREMHEKLKREGVLAGRSISVSVDYDRKFVAKRSDIGETIDRALEALRLLAPKAKDAGRPTPEEYVLNKAWDDLSRAVNRNFPFYRRMQLLEGIKADLAIPDVEKHLALGRKVVIFHDFNQGLDANPFDVRGDLPTEEAQAAFDQWMASVPGLADLTTSQIVNPVERLTAAFGKRAVVYNGTVSKKERAERLIAFNTDGSGTDIIIVQADAGKEGVSMHDITGTHQRALINLGMPVKPTTTLQQEGRTRRLGAKTDAPFRYYTIGTTWERQAFASKIATRSGTVENLALGNEARTIRDSFISAYIDAADMEPSPDDGKGGSEADRATAKTSPYETAKTHYYGRMKNTRKRDNRQGAEFYATPEPLGFKIVEWAGVRPNEKVLEPSVGDGAIGRYLPENTDNTVIDSSNELLTMAALRVPGSNAILGDFEGHHITNKYDAVVMNPPFGVGGKTAIEHLAKAARHLRDGGRIVALIPTGPSADKRFDAWIESDEASELHVAADITLPGVTFEKAGTGVLTRVVVIDKTTDKAVAMEIASRSKRINMTGSDTIAALFDRLEGITVPERVPPVGEAGAIADAEALNPTPETRQPGAKAVPVEGVPDFKLAKVVNPITKADGYVATPNGFVPKETFNALRAVADGHNGYYDKGKAEGMKRGFVFPTEADREAFLSDMRGPVVGFEETAYHGTPHTFDRFSLDAIGTGEGAQAYGWGLYFAGKRQVAEHYREALSAARRKGTPAHATLDGNRITAKNYGDLPDMAFFSRPAIRTMLLSGAESGFMSAVDENIEARRDSAKVYRERAAKDRANPPFASTYSANELDEMAAMDERAVERFQGLKARIEFVARYGGGNLFTVEIPDSDMMLDWEGLVSNHSEAIQAALAPVLDAMRKHYRSKDRALLGGVDGFIRNLTGREVIDFLQGHGATWGFEPDGYEFTKRTEPGVSYVIHEVRMTSTGNKIGEGSERARAIKDALIRPDQYASLALRKLGIPGHRYLDGGSRGAGEGSHNYVIYDPDTIQIIEREQQPGVLEGPTADAAAIRHVLPALRAELDRLDLKRVRLDLDPKTGRQGAFTVDGTGAMDILIGASLNPMATLYHEVIHALRHMNLFTADEWAALSKAAANGWVEKHDIPARYPDLMPSEMIEEAIAEEFAERWATKASPKGSVLIRAFNKIARMIKALRAVMTGAGYPTPESVFGDVMAGRISARNAGNTGAAVIWERAKAQALPVRARRTMVNTKQNRAHGATAMMGTSLHIPDRGVWNELSRSGAGIWARLGGAAGAMNDQIDKARIKIQDRFLPVLRAQEAVLRAAGGKLPVDHDAYLKETTFSGKVGRHLFEIDEDYTKPIIALIAETKGNLTADDVGTWLYARHATERNAQIAKINPNMPDGGSGMLEAEAAAILSQAAAGPHAARLKKIGDLIDKLRDSTSDLRLNAGLITPLEATTWRNQYKHYVPLKGFADTDHSEAMLDITGVGSRFNTRGPETRRALGRQSEAFNPLVAALTQAQEVAIRAEKNQVGAALYRLAKDHPSKALWSVKTPKMVRFYNRTTGLVESRVEDPVSIFLQPNEMAVKIDGQEHRIIFHDERLAAAAGTVGADRMGWFISMMSMAARYFSSVNTMLDPEFVIRNAFRDMTAAQINIRNFGDADRNKIAKAMIRDWPKAFAAAYMGQGSTKADTDWKKWWKEFEESGAKVSFWKMDQPEAAKDDMAKRIKLAGGGSAIYRASRFIRLSTRDNPVLSFIERTNLAADNAVRLAAYVAARKAGWERQDAAALSKNLTVNFNRRGEWGATINSLYIFANASIQGTQVLVRAFSKKRMAKYAVGGVALGVIMDMVNASLSEEDEDGELAYDKIPNWKNTANLTVMLGPDAGSAATIWLPYGYSMFPYLGQQIGKVSRGVKSPGEAMGDMAAALFGSFSPISGGTFQSTITPTMLDPVNELAMNQDFLGRPIRPEQPYSDYGPDAYKFYSGASAASRLIADVANRATGGTVAESGLIDVSPEYIDHVFGFMAGGAGRFVGRSVDLATKLVTGQEEAIQDNDIPFYRQLRYDTGTWLDRERYYRFRDDVRTAVEAKDTYAEVGQPVPADVRNVAALDEALRTIERDLRQIRAGRRALDANESLSLSVKAERRARIDEAEARLMMNFNRLYVRRLGPQGE